MIHTGEPAYAPELNADDITPTFAPTLVDAIRDQIERHQPLLVSVIGGNVHNALSLMRHERSFDFRLSGEPSPPLDSEADLLPEGLVAATLARAMASDFRRMRALHAIAGPFTQVESPPPVRDSAFIEAAAEAFFLERGIATHGAASAGLRYRMWRLASRLVRAEAGRLGWRTLDVPASLRDADGFLLPHLAADATHGNRAYGDMLIDALA